MHAMNLIAAIHLIRGGEPAIEPYAVVILALWVRHGLRELRFRGRWIDRVHDRVILQIARVSREEIRGVLPDRSAHVTAKEQLIVRRLCRGEGIVGVERTR